MIGRRAIAVGLAVVIGSATVAQAPVQAQAQVQPQSGPAADRPAADRSARGYADPGRIIADESALNRLARTKGQWSALRQTAAAQAVLFVPARVAAQAWLAKRADPSVAVSRQPQAVWASCDGSYAVTRGAWRQAAATGWFVTVWQRQTKGDYRWLLDIGDALPTALEAPEMIAGKVADCPSGGPPGSPPGDAGGAFARGKRAAKFTLLPLADPAAAQSPDASLRWNVAIDARGAGTVSVALRTGGTWQDVANERVVPTRSPAR